MIIELRTYTTKVGAIRTVEERFAKALPGRVKLSPLGGLWHTEVGALNQVIHVWPYESLAQRESVRAAAAKVENWPPDIQEFLVDAKSEIFVPAPFSPAIEPRQLGSLYELRRYTFAPGTLPTVIQRWGEKIEARIKMSPLVGCWYSEIAPLNQWIHIWAYRDYAERERIRADSVKQGVWPPNTPGMLLRMENLLMTPADFSPLR